MKWVTRAHVHVDRVACPWLIHRFIDPKAEFKFVIWPGYTLDDNDGIPFDFPDMDITFTHHDNKCTFEVLIEHYDLRDPVLQDLALIIHGADVVRDIDKSPESKGAELILSGLAYINDDDQQAIASGFRIFDSLYAGLLLRRLRQEFKETLEQMSREDTFQFLFSKMREHLPATIQGGPTT
jgi:hypothetical protein